MVRPPSGNRACIQLVSTVYADVEVLYYFRDSLRCRAVLLRLESGLYIVGIKN